MRTSVSDPAGPEVEIDAEGTSRTKALTSGSSSRSMRVASMIVTLAGVSASGSGAREAVMTIPLLSIGVTGMAILLLTNMSSQEGAPSVPWLVPAGKRTTDCGKFLTSRLEPLIQLRAQRRTRTGFLLNQRP